MGRFAVALTSSGREALHLSEHPLSRSYGANLPSSLTMVLSSALGYSPRPPVSVSSTDTLNLERLEDFLEGPSGHFGT